MIIHVVCNACLLYFLVGSTWFQQIEEDPVLPGFTGVVAPSNFSGDALPLLRRIYESK
jgi:hypothetical protein